jgi:hypothetical protein
MIGSSASGRGRVSLGPGELAKGKAIVEEFFSTLNS